MLLTKPLYSNPHTSWVAHFYDQYAFAFVVIDSSMLVRTGAIMVCDYA